jgi:hypothetical protein
MARVVIIGASKGNRALFCTIKHTDDGLGMPACASRSQNASRR